MNRLTVLVAASSAPLRSAVHRTLETRNYEILDHALNPGLASVLDERPHQLAVLAPDDSEEALAVARAYREAARERTVQVVALVADDVLGAELGDVFMPVGPQARGNIDRDDLLDAIDKATRHLLTILVADDEPLIRRMFSMYFENEGYKVVTAEDGEEAIRRVRQVLPDLVITDIQMPNLDGFELCRAIKESRDTQHIPVVIVSALGSDVDIGKGFNAGANEYVTKPVDLHELSGRMRDIFRGIATRGRERILVVTANQIERSILEYGLTQQGFEVAAASTGTRALDIVTDAVPSVMVCDLKIPELELVELRTRLRETDRTANIPLVVLSEAATKLNRATRDKLKAAAYITKPFPIERLVVTIERILGERRSNLELEREILLQTIKSLITTLEARDSYTRGHSENVARYTKLIAMETSLSEEAIKRIELSAQLHDIGKIGVPDAILLKPGKLTDEEWRIMQTHPVLGAEILTPIQSLRDVLPGVRWHHERIDGKGYPDGLAGDEIPLMARIIGVADTFDALTSNRPYRRGRTVEEAMTIIREVAGTQLDAELVRIFDEITSRPSFRRPDPGRKAEPIPAGT